MLNHIVPQNLFKVIIITFSLLFYNCQGNLTGRANSIEDNNLSAVHENKEKIFLAGDEKLDLYLPLLKDKNIGLVVNQSSIINQTHLIDTLISHQIQVKKVFAPEHGIRGKADAGEKISDAIDTKTGLPIISLYGKHKKPYKKDLEGLDIVIFDLQDVGARFYTYISTMHLVMEACAENNVQVLILDRPNPNGDYVAGPILEKKYSSFVGMHPIPIVHGLTVGELAHMINGEGWLANGVTCDLTVIPCQEYSHKDIHALAIKPSPNLPTLNSIRWYPSLCLFEPTVVSIGRGTLHPFEVMGNPTFDSNTYPFSFKPKSILGMSKYPKHENKTCYGIDFRDSTNGRKMHYDFLIQAYKKIKPEKFFLKESQINFFYKLCGTDKIYQALKDGKTVEEMEQLFEEDLSNYKILRKKYLLYPDFE